MKIISLFLTAGFIFGNSIVWAGPGTSTTGSRGGGNEIAMQFQAAFVTACDALIVSENQEYLNLVNVIFGANIAPSNSSSELIGGIKFLVSDHLSENAVALADTHKLIIYINARKWQKIDNYLIKSAIALHFIMRARNIPGPQNDALVEAFIKDRGVSINDIKAYTGSNP